MIGWLKHIYVGLSITLLMVPGLSLSQVRDHTTFKPQSGEKVIREMLKDWRQEAFVQMEPRKAYIDYLFLGELTAEERKYFDRQFLQVRKKVPNSLRLRYFSLLAAKDFPQLYLALGKRDLSSDLTSTIQSELEAAEPKFKAILNTVLQNYSMTRESYDSFFKQHGDAVTDSELTRIEEIFDELVASVRANISQTVYSRNLTALFENWELRKERIGKKGDYLIILRPLLAFVAATKGGRVKIIDFPQYVD